MPRGGEQGALALGTVSGQLGWHLTGLTPTSGFHQLGVKGSVFTPLLLFFLFWGEGEALFVNIMANSYFSAVFSYFCCHPSLPSVRKIYFA